MRGPLPILLSYMKTEVPLVVLWISCTKLYSHKHINWAICITGEMSNTRIARRYFCYIFFLSVSFDGEAYLSVNTISPVAAPRKFQHAFDLIILLLLRSYAAIIRKREINSVQIIVLICINQRVSSLNKWCFLSFLASISAGAPLCIFVKWAKHAQRASEAAFLKPGGKIMFCGYRMN